MNPSSLKNNGPLFKEESSEVFYCQYPIQVMNQEWIQFLKKKASQNSRKRARICHHGEPSDRLQEMLIVMHHSNYVRPHKHFKAESFHLIQGKMDVLLFDDQGKILYKIPLEGGHSWKNNFYYRLSQPFFHTIFIRSDWVIFHEVTEGPFLKEKTVFAPWAPEEDESERGLEYLKKMSKKKIPNGIKP